MKNTKRAERRHEEKKCKAEARRRLRAKGTPKVGVTARVVGVLAHSSAICSCALCGNRRRYGKGNAARTRQETTAAMRQRESQETKDDNTAPAW